MIYLMFAVLVSVSHKLSVVTFALVKQTVVRRKGSRIATHLIELLGYSGTPDRPMAAMK